MTNCKACQGYGSVGSVTCKNCKGLGSRPSSIMDGSLLRKLMTFLLNGLSNTEIAHALGIDEADVKHRMTFLFQITGTHDRLSLCKYLLKYMECDLFKEGLIFFES